MNFVAQRKFINARQKRHREEAKRKISSLLIISIISFPYCCLGFCMGSASYFCFPQTIAETIAKFTFVLQ
jgi:hypothetical protein